MCGRGRTHLRAERGCLPDRCRAPQNGTTPLHWAATRGHVAVVEQLLAAGADKEPKNKVRGVRVRDASREVSRGNTHLVVSFCLLSCEKSAEISSPSITRTGIVVA